MHNFSTSSVLSLRPSDAESSSLAALPVPKRQYRVFSDSKQVESAVNIKQPPKYLRRRGFIPKSQEDFGDGGAFPEISVAQYPRGMGKINEFEVF